MFLITKETVINLDQVINFFISGKAIFFRYPGEAQALIISFPDAQSCSAAYEYILIRLNSHAGICGIIGYQG